MAIPLLDYRGRPTGEVLEREQFHRSPIPPVENRRRYPAGHGILYDVFGNILTQTRSDDKKFLPGEEIPVHGGHLVERDMYKRGQRYVLNWRTGTIREIKEEIGILLNWQDLQSICAQPVDFSEISGFENSVYLKLFSAIYHPKWHGPIIIDRREIKEAKFVTPSYLEKHNLFKFFGEPYASKLTERVITDSKKISRFNF